MFEKDEAQFCVKGLQEEQEHVINEKNVRITGECESVIQRKVIRAPFLAVIIPVCLSNDLTIPCRQFSIW